MTIAIWALFIFIALGTKLILALVTIYLLLPDDQRCSGCDTETLLMEMDGGVRLVSRMTGGRVERRWCPKCGWDGLGRGRPGSRWSVPVETPHSPRQTPTTEP